LEKIKDKSKKIKVIKKKKIWLLVTGYLPSPPAGGYGGSWLLVVNGGCMTIVWLLYDYLNNPF